MADFVAHVLHGLIFFQIMNDPTMIRSLRIHLVCKWIKVGGRHGVGRCIMLTYPININIVLSSSKIFV